MRPIAALKVAMTARPTSSLVLLTTHEQDQTQRAEYIALATKLGVGVMPSLRPATFENLLLALEMPVYSEEEVVKYMDAMAARDAKGRNGWMWKALRPRDEHMIHMQSTFGRRYAHYNDEGTLPASNYWSTNNERYELKVPLHALQKVDLIESHHKEPVGFLVSDYAPKAKARPDPFLMAVVPGGRYIIDFWDEPGFGIMQMVK